LKAPSDRAAAFRSATVKGWAYALEHKEALVDLILRSYSAKKSREALLFRQSTRRCWSAATYALASRIRALASHRRALSQARTAHDDTLATCTDLGWKRRQPLALVDSTDCWCRRDGNCALVAYRRRRSLQVTLARFGVLPLFATMGRPRLS